MPVTVMVQVVAHVVPQQVVQQRAIMVHADIHVVLDIVIMVRAVRAWGLTIIFIIINARRTQPRTADRTEINVPKPMQRQHAQVVHVFIHAKLTSAT